jgi:hypothetical protein
MDLYIYLVCCFVAVGGFLFGYDIGVIRLVHLRATLGLLC